MGDVYMEERVQQYSSGDSHSWW